MTSKMPYPTSRSRPGVRTEARRHACVPVRVCARVHASHLHTAQPNTSACTSACPCAPHSISRAHTHSITRQMNMATSPLLNGKWALVYASERETRSSPFFWCLYFLTVFAPPCSPRLSLSPRAPAPSGSLETLRAFRKALNGWSSLSFILFVLIVYMSLFCTHTHTGRSGRRSRGSSSHSQSCLASCLSLSLPSLTAFPSILSAAPLRSPKS